MNLDSESASDLEINTPSDVLEQATSAATQILPEKSRSRYDTLYKKFMDWRCGGRILIVFVVEKVSYTTLNVSSNYSLVGLRHSPAARAQFSNLRVIACLHYSLCNIL